MQYQKGVFNMSNVAINAEVASNIFKAAYWGYLEELEMYRKRNENFKNKEGRNSDIAQHHIARVIEQIDRLVKLAKENNIAL